MQYEHPECAGLRRSRPDGASGCAVQAQPTGRMPNDQAPITTQHRHYKLSPLMHHAGGQGRVRCRRVLMVGSTEAVCWFRAYMGCLLWPSVSGHSDYQSDITLIGDMSRAAGAWQAATWPDLAARTAACAGAGRPRSRRSVPGRSWSSSLTRSPPITAVEIMMVIFLPSSRPPQVEQLAAACSGRPRCERRRTAAAFCAVARSTQWSRRHA